MASSAAHALPATDAREALKSHLNSDITEMRERMAAVISATHDAAMMIIGTVEETFEQMGADLSPDLQEKLFSVLSACAFQDIAGQHLARMTELLNDIQHAAAHAAMNDTQANETLGRRKNQLTARVARMTGGPAIADEGLAQADVDWLINATLQSPD